MGHNRIKEIYTDMFKWMPDKMYITMSYFIKTHSIMHWSKPQSFSEKLQWLKVYNRKQKYTDMVDKYEVKKFYSDVVGSEYCIPTLGVWDDADSIDFSKLPESYVLKCTHDSGSVIICNDKKSFNIENAKAKLSKHLTRNLYFLSREWPYKNVKPRIIAEPLLKNKDGSPIKDYKILCFNGEPRIVYVTIGRGVLDKYKINYYDLEWNRLDITHINYGNYIGTVEKPSTLEQMVKLAKKLSRGIPFVRVDFFDIDGKIYAGEMTFFPDGGWGFNKATSKEINKKLGELIVLPKKSN